MDDEDVAKPVEKRRVWLERHLHQAAKRLGTTLSGDEIVNTYDMRSAGSRALYLVTATPATANPSPVLVATYSPFEATATAHVRS